MRHGLRVLGALWRSSFAVSLQYRLEFAGEGVLALFWTSVALVPLWVVFAKQGSVAGWTFPEALVVLGWFVALKGGLEGAIVPSLLAVVEHVRKGTLDYVLLKPADAQLLVSFSRVEPWRAVDLLAAGAIFARAFHQLGRHPSAAQVLSAAIMLMAALAVLYSLALLVVSVAFIAVRVDNLIHLLGSLFDIARWPSSIFRGALALFFTFVLPLPLMTSYPALALLGKLRPALALGWLLGAGLFAAAARAVWLRSLSRYTSASS